MNAAILSISSAEEPVSLYRTTADKPTIRQLVTASQGAPRGVKEVLAEVCALFENGGRKCFDANNRHLAERLGMTIPMVSRNLHALQDKGLLLISEAVAGQRRTITPSEELQQAYRSGSVDTLTDLIRGAYRRDKPTLIVAISPPYRDDKHNRKELEVEGEQKTFKNEVVQELEAARAALAELRLELDKVNQERQAEQAEWEQLKEQARAVVKKRDEKIAALTAELMEVKKKPVKQPKQKAERPAVNLATYYAHEAAELPAEQRAQWDGFCSWLDDNPLPRVNSMEKPLRPADLLKLLNTYTQGEIIDGLLGMENHPTATKNIYTSLTLTKWMKRTRTWEDDATLRQHQRQTR